MWYWYKDRPIDQWNRIEKPKINPHFYGQLIFDKNAKIIQWEKNNLFNKWCLDNWISTYKRMNLDPNLTVYVKTNLIFFITFLDQSPKCKY